MLIKVLGKVSAYLLPKRWSGILIKLKMP